MNIALKPFSERRLSADQVAVELRAKLRNIPGTAVTIINQPIIRVGARGARSNYQYTLKGLDQKELEAASVRLLRAMQQDPTFVGVNSDHDFASQSAQVEIDRPRAASLGITPDQIEGALGAAFGGEQVSQIYTSIDQYQVVLELLPQYQQDASALSRLYLYRAGRSDGAADCGDKNQPRDDAPDHQSFRPDSLDHHLLRPRAGKSAERCGCSDGQGDRRNRPARDRPGQLLPERPRHSKARTAIWDCCC